MPGKPVPPAQGDASRIAIVALGKRGVELAKKLHWSLGDCDLYVPERFHCEDSGHSYSSVKDLLPGLFSRYRALVLFMPAGAAVRLLAPLLTDKYHDPAVVAVDEAGKFAVSLLSGHVGGANELAERVASALGAQAIITSAAESLETLPLDLLGKELGWQIEDRTHMTRVSAALVNGEAVALFQEAGRKDWWPASKPWPDNIRRSPSLAALRHSRCQGAIIITDRVYSQQQIGIEHNVVFRPRSLVLGLGCHRGLAMETLEEAIGSIFQKFDLSPLSIAAVATISSRTGEPGLTAFADKHHFPVAFLTPAQLEQVDRVPNPSGTVLRHLGLKGVCEPAALLASNGGELLVEKQKLRDLTLAVARSNFGDTPVPQATVPVSRCFDPSRCLADQARKD
ncbi:MAG: cobalamin biosynthesis protein [Chloroflexi bacterium]|nr:cobalamin biosynthesis protein [Chloroflexota bacterium]